jgi:hypothetical protein
MRRTNSKHLAPCEDDDSTGDNGRGGVAAQAWQPGSWRLRPQPQPPRRPPGHAMDSLAGVVREEVGAALRWRLCGG